MKDSNEILKRVQLLMNYEMGKTLEENTKNVDNTINEQIPGAVGKLFRIGGEELTGGLRTAMEDASRIFRGVGGIEIKNAEGAVVRAKNADELIDALHAGRMTENTIGELYTGLLKSPKTPSTVIDTILSNTSFDVAFKSRYGSLMNNPEGLFNTLKQKGYSESTIEKMMKKVGVERTVTSAAKGALNDEELNAISSTFTQDMATMNTDEVENLIRDFAKKRNIKIKESELKTIAEDGIKKIRQQTKNFEANAKDFEKWWNERATTIDKEKFLNSIITNPPKGVSQSMWGNFVKSLFKKVGTGVGKILLTLYAVGMGASFITNIIAYFTGIYGETGWDVIKNTVWWPGGLKNAMDRVSGVTSDNTGQGGSGQSGQTPQKDNRQKIDW